MCTRVYGYGPIDPSEPAPMTGFIMNYNNTSGIKANNTVNGTCSLAGSRLVLLACSPK